MCVGFCPENVMVQCDDYLEPSKCTACGLCVKHVRPSDPSGRRVKEEKGMIKMCDLPRYADANMEEIKNERGPHGSQSGYI